MKINWPAAKAEVRTPITKPRLAVNQRVATVAAKLRPIIPDAAPKNSPMLNSKCHFSYENIVHNNPKISNETVIYTIFDTPNFNIRDAPKGHIIAMTKYIRPVASEKSEISHPYASVIGRIKICGTLPTAGATIENKNAIVAITQA
jgi:hypothetical protein